VAGPAAEAAALEQRLLECLHDVEDAEMPLDVVDLGLIYGLRYREPGKKVEVDMTFTAMGCPAMEFMIGDVRDRLLREPEVDSVHVEVVWDPPWDKRRLTERGAAALATWGII
jgi:metal-sulfur cluster biosynthetic enzyme